MLVPQATTAVALLVALVCSGCTDKDREIAKRNNDGTENFQFKAPEKSVPSTSQKSPETSSTVPKVQLVPPKDSDGSDTFRFKPDPKHSPNSSATGKK